MPTPPAYDPDLIIHTINTAVEYDCGFCQDKIDPRISFEHFLITIPGKVGYRLHTECMEQLQWTMLNYYVRYIKQPKPSTLVN